MGSDTFLMVIKTKSHFYPRKSGGYCRPVEAMVFLTASSQRAFYGAWAEREMKYGQGLFFYSQNLKHMVGWRVLALSQT